jgi:hypothetical protein
LIAENIDTLEFAGKRLMAPARFMRKTLGIPNETLKNLLTCPLLRGKNQTAI